MRTYPVIDPPSDWRDHVDGWAKEQLRARWTGENRPPRKGEYYLSGAVVEAYRAMADLETAYPIATLIVTTTRTVETVIREYPT